MDATICCNNTNDSEWRVLSTLNLSRYEAHPNGLFRNRYSKVSLIGKPGKYLALYLIRDDNKRKTLRLDKLMLELFVGPPPNNKPDVLHINGDNSDCSINNLKWCNLKEENQSPEALLKISLPGEQWESCKLAKFSLHYASSLGRIYSVASATIIPGTVHQNGYRYMSAISDKGMKTVNVHKLVCYAFHGKKPTKEHTVDHIDRNPLNNMSSNLRWATKREQMLNQNEHKEAERYILKIINGNIIQRYTEYDGRQASDNTNLSLFENGFERNGIYWIYEDKYDFPGEEWRILSLPKRIKAGEELKGSPNKEILISNMGRIKPILNPNSRPSRRLKIKRTRGAKTNDGYFKTTVGGRGYFMHRLVYETFIGKIPDDFVVNHIDGVRTNNNINNLNLMTESENCMHKYETGTMRGKSVNQYTLAGEYIRTFTTIGEAARAVNVAPNTISDVVDKPNRSAGTYRWTSYKDENVVTDIADSLDNITLDEEKSEIPFQLPSIESLMAYPRNPQVPINSNETPKIVQLHPKRPGTN